LVDDRKSHVLPVALNDLNNALSAVLGLSEISLTSQPILSNSIATAFDGLLFTGSMFIGFTYVIMVMGLAMELIQDREVCVC
jgi:hypothetical protein